MHIVQYALLSKRELFFNENAKKIMLNFLRFFIHLKGSMKILHTFVLFKI